MPLYNTYTELVLLISGYLSRNDISILDKIPTFIGLAEEVLARLPKTIGTKRVVVSTMQKGQPVIQKPARYKSPINLNFGKGEIYNITNFTSVAGAHTLFLTEPHTFAVGQTVLVSGTGNATFDAVQTITARTPTSITFISGVTSGSGVISGNVSQTVLNDATFLSPKSYEFCKQFWPNSSKEDAPRYYADYDKDNFLIVPTPAFSYPFELAYFEKPEPLSDANQSNWFTTNMPDALLYGALLQAMPYLKNDERVDTWKKYYAIAIDSIAQDSDDGTIDGTIDREKSR
jgi:hypothetical protein